jgi:diguanylate cyclase (GGDEF)-like protein/PAS domain S-box-containing protein
MPEFLRSAARRLRWPIRVILIAFGLVLPVLLYVGFAQAIRREATDNALARLRAVAGTTAGGTRQLIDGTAVFFDVIDAAAEGSANPSAEPRLRSELRSYVAFAVARSPVVERAFLFDERGRGFDFAKPSGMAPIHASAAFLSAIPEGARGAIGLARGDDIDELSGSGGILVTRAGADRGAQLRYVVLSLHPSRLRDLFESAEAGVHGIVLLLDKNGRVLFTEPDSAYFGGKNTAALPVPLHETLSAPENVTLATLGDGVARYYRQVVVPTSGASIVVGVAREDIEGGLADKLSLAGWAIGALWFAMLAAGAALLLFDERARQLTRGLSAQAEVVKFLQAQNRATLDSARASIAILDETGTIVDVNQSWHQFAEGNGYATPDHGIGRNYLEASAPVTPAHAGPNGVPPGLKAGLEDVLAGRLEVFHVEYPCHAPTKKRWFEAYFTPLALGKASGAVARHVDVTERVVAEQEVRKNGTILAAIDAVLPVIIYQRSEKNGAWDYTFVNDHASEIIGRTADGMLSKSDFAIGTLHPDDHDRVAQSYALVVAAGGGVWKSEFRCIAPQGTVKWLRGAVYIGARDGREVESLGILYDVTDERTASERAHFTQEHDGLTGLFSRSHLEAAVPASVERWIRLNSFFAVVILDIDNFHEINEAYGTQVGDDVLRALAKALSLDVPAARDITRLDADKFAFIADVGTVEDALALAADAVAVLGRPQRSGGHTIGLSVSAGIAVPRHFAVGASDLLHDANSALERARGAGGGTFRLYSDEMGIESTARATLKEQLREALDRGEFELHYQPKIDLVKRKVVGCEALIRWNHPTFGFQAPGRFIPIAEQSGLIVPIGAWVIEEACRQYVAWRDAGVPVVPIAVNVSAVQFARADVFALIASTMESTGAAAGSLDIEVTESLFIDCSRELVATLQNIHRLGVEIGLDDFGTGFSSFGYLKQLPLSVIKADQSFVRGAVENASDAAIVRSIVHLTAELGLRVIAEGVETLEQLNFVRSAGCAEAQGYYFSPPLMAHDFAWYLTDGRALLAQKLDAVEASRPAPAIVGKSL